MNGTDHNSVPLPALLCNVGEEFARMASEVESLQDTLSAVFVAAQADPRLVEGAQALDLVLQHLTQLGALVQRTALRCEPQWRVSTEAVLGDISLSALSHRLRGGDAASELSGELEVF